MSGMFAMRRANGDWFAFEEHGNLRVKLGHGQLIDHAQFALLMHEPTEQLRG